MGLGHGKEVDWWSLGILIFEMLVGLVSFQLKMIFYLFLLDNVCVSNFKNL